MSIAFRIALSALSAVIVVLVPMSYFSYKATFDVIHKQLRITQPMFAKLVDTHIAGQVKSCELMARSIRRDIAGGHLETPKGFYSLFQSVLVDDNAFVGLVVALDPDGPQGRREAWYLYKNEEEGFSDWIDLAAPEVEPPYTDRDWFVEPARTRRPYWTKPYYGRATGIPMITYSLPLFDEENRLTGVLACDVSLQWLDRFIAEIDLPRQDVNEIFILAGDGMIVADKYWGQLHRNIFTVAEEGGDANLGEVGRKMTAGEQGFMEYRNPDGSRQGIVVFMPIDDGNGNGVKEWSLGVFVPQSALKGFAISVGGTQVLIGLTGIAAMVVLLLYVSHSISAPIRQLEEAALTIASGDLDAEVPDIHGRDEVSRLAKSFTRMQADLKSQIVSLAETTRAKEQLESDLRIGRRIQMSLVPTHHPETPLADRFDLAAFIEPARDVGGDFYDYFLLDDETLCLVIADVSGKGVPASLLMSRGSAFFRTYLLGSRRLGFALELVNRELCRDNTTNMFITLFAVVVHLPTGKCRYAGAGHNPPFLVPAEKTPQMLRLCEGLPLGIDDDRYYAETELQLRPDDLLYLYTDGVTEALNPDVEQFGENRTSESLENSERKSCQEILDRILENLHTFTRDMPQSDDITMVAFRYRGKP